MDFTLLFSISKYIHIMLSVQNFADNSIVRSKLSKILLK